MIGKKLTRSNERMIGGVCAGLAEYIDIDHTVFRAIYAILTICTCFSGIIIYIILWLIMPPK